MNNIIMDGQDGNGNLYHGFWFDSVDMVTLTTFEARAQQDGIRLNGAVGSNPKANLFLDVGKVVQCNIGVHCGGAFGGLQIGNKVDIINNATGFRLSQDIIAEVNREIFLIGTMLDSTTSGSCFEIDDPATNCKITLSGIWIASATTYGINVVQGNPRINLDGKVFNCGVAGLHITAGDPVISIGTSEWQSNNNADITADATDAPFNNIYISKSAIMASKAQRVDWTRVSPQVGQIFDVVLADDTATSFTPESNTGLLYMDNQGSPRYGLLRYSATGSPSTTDISSTAGAVVLTTGALTGTTGTDARITIASHTDGKIYVENRIGSQQRIRLCLQ